MTAIRLAGALRGDGDRVVCFGRDAGELRLAELSAAASGVAQRVHALDGERWALNLDDAFAFTAALLGCWAAGRTAVIAPRPLLAELGAAAFDGVIELATDSTSAQSRVLWQDIEPSSRPLDAIEPSAALVLYTSGSTGTPKEACRRLANIETELGALESLWGDGLAQARVFATVSHRHVYGMLFRVLWPLLARRPFASYDCEYPEQLLGAIGCGNILISSPAMLKRLDHLPNGAGEWRAVFSSGGALPPPAAAGVARVLGPSAIEVYGSTETSGVAWRSTDAASSGYRLLPGVEVRVRDELLEVRSPFAGRDDWQAMGDRASVSADGSLELAGRADRIAKIEDKRVSLPEIELRLRKHSFVADAAVIALEDGRRQYIGAVVELTDAGQAALGARGARAIDATLRAALRGRMDPVAIPRAYRYPRTIPVDAQGKRNVATLCGLFEQKR